VAIEPPSGQTKLGGFVDRGRQPYDPILQDRRRAGARSIEEDEHDKRRAQQKKSRADRHVPRSSPNAGAYHSKGPEKGQQPYILRNLALDAVG
jgi:hypothetical protein